MIYISYYTGMENKLKKLIELFYSQQKIAEELGITKGYAKSLLNKYNLKTKRKPKSKCKTCGKTLNRKNKRYCSQTCKIEYEHNEYIKVWKNTGETSNNSTLKISNHIRKYLFDKYVNKCSKCGWGVVNNYTNKIPLEVEHIDGNHIMPKLPFINPYIYKGANRGKGRKNRKKT